MDIFPVAPAPQPEPSIQNSTSPGTDDTGFDTVLNKTISSAEKSSGTSKESQANNKPDGKTVDNSDSPRHRQQEGDADGSPDVGKVPADSGNQKDTPVAPPKDTTTEQPNYNSVYVTTVSLNALLQLPQNSNQGQEQNLAGETIPADFKNVQLSFKNLQAAVNKEIPPIATVPQETESLKGSNEGTGRQNSLLLSEIDKLITQNGDKVTISAQFGNNGGKSREMPGYLNSPLLSKISTNTTEISVSTSELPVAAPTVPAPNHLKADGVQPTLRQETGNQLLTARLAEIETEIDSESSAEKEFKSNTGSGQQASSQQTTSSTGAATVPEHTGANQLFSTIFASSQTPVQAETSVAQQLHSLHQQHFINENKVISQIVNRFSIQTRLQSGRISLQLHPAELGELKIDVEMKGDSLKANIVAQTQQAQDIIEKNIPRLKAALQEHGMTIEDLLVTIQSDSVEDYSQQQNHFQDHLGSFHDPTGSVSQVSPELHEDTVEPEISNEKLTAVNMMV